MRTTRHHLQVATPLAHFVDNEVLPGTGITPADFWAGFDAIVRDLAPQNAALLAERERLQTELDTWHSAHPGPIGDMPAYRAFLRRIGYLAAPAGPVQCTTQGVDDELARLAGPQLVVPILNARYALNAANARWGSLYDALYGTDAIPDKDGAQRGPTGSYNPIRGAKVIAFARRFLDQAVPLAPGAEPRSHAQAENYVVDGGALLATLASGARVPLADPAAFVGFSGDAAAPHSLLLRHHGLHIELKIDRTAPIGRSDPAGLADVVLEAALSTILDLEDSVAAVDAEDKIVGYRNWLGILKGTLTETVAKAGKTFTRGLNPDRRWHTPDGLGEVE